MNKGDGEKNATDHQAMKAGEAGGSNSEERAHGHHLRE
jgi:hypothetical protein